MFEQPQQSVQGQTSQPNPQTQTPQSSTDTNLQGSTDQQVLESTNSTIVLPRNSHEASNQQAGVVQSSADTVTSPNQYAGTSLLVGSFVLAVTLILLLARVAVVASPSDQDVSQ